jgi:hypothetical protein
MKKNKSFAYEYWTSDAQYLPIAIFLVPITLLSGVCLIDLFVDIGVNLQSAQIVIAIPAGIALLDAAIFLITIFIRSLRCGGK